MSVVWKVRLAAQAVLDFSEIVTWTSENFGERQAEAYAETLTPATPVVDLERPPFDADAAIWQHPTEYASTQQFARVAREVNVGGILYRSVRDPKPSWCLALLTPAGFAKPKPHAERQTSYLAVSPHEVTLRRDTESMQFSAEGW